MQKFFCLVLLILLSAGAVPAQKVKVGADPKVDLTKYKTYAWDKGGGAANPIINGMIIEAVEAALASKGFTKVSSNADVTVVAWAALGADLQVGYPSWWHGAGSAASTGMNVGEQRWAISKGTLVVDIADGGTKESVWRGSAVSTLSSNPTGDMAKDAKEVRKPIIKSVEKMFKHYPKP